MTPDQSRADGQGQDTGQDQNVRRSANSGQRTGNWRSRGISQSQRIGRSSGSGQSMGGELNDVLASIGVLTAIPVARLPRRRSATLGLAPVVGGLLGLIAGGCVLACRWLFPGPDGALVAAAITLAVLGLLTRGLHLDGLADTADGFGPLRDRDAALAAMREPGVGAFGVATLVIVLVLEFAALARDVTLGRGFAGVLVAVVAGRLAMMWAGVPGIPAARPGGLGAAVAGSVPWPLAWSMTGLALAGTLAPAVFGSAGLAVRLAIAALAALAAGQLLRWRAVRRFGGITGDVLGACGELATLAALLVTAIR